MQRCTYLLACRKLQRKCQQMLSLFYFKHNFNPLTPQDKICHTNPMCACMSHILKQMVGFKTISYSVFLRTSRGRQQDRFNSY